MACPLLPGAKSSPVRTAATPPTTAPRPSRTRSCLTSSFPATAPSLSAIPGWMPRVYVINQESLSFPSSSVWSCGALFVWQWSNDPPFVLVPFCVFLAIQNIDLRRTLVSEVALIFIHVGRALLRCRLTCFTTLVSKTHRLFENTRFYSSNESKKWRELRLSCGPRHMWGELKKRSASRCLDSEACKSV